MFNASKEEVSVTAEILEILLVEFGILGFRVQNTAQGIWNPRSTDIDESWIQYLESRIHGLESRIQDCFEFPWMGCYYRLEYSVMWYIEGPQ